MDHLCYLGLVLLCFHAHLLVDALWPPAGKGLTSWLSFVMSNCDVVTFSLVSWSGVVLDCIDSLSLPIFLLLKLNVLLTIFVQFPVENRNFSNDLPFN